MNTIGYFEIQADDPLKAKDFYVKVFGWKFFKDDALPIEYWQIQTDTINGGLLKRPANVPPPQSGTYAFVCSIQVEDFDKIAIEILKHGGKVALEKFAVPGRCWQGYFIDPQDNTFGLFQVDESAK
ncbi:MAG: VOC family protein [Candidatus Levyibacteriota bacterium]